MLRRMPHAQITRGSSACTYRSSEQAPSSSRATARAARRIRSAATASTTSRPVSRRASSRSRSSGPTNSRNGLRKPAPVRKRAAHSLRWRRRPSPPSSRPATALPSAPALQKASSTGNALRLSTHVPPRHARATTPARAGRSPVVLAIYSERFVGLGVAPPTLHAARDVAALRPSARRRRATTAAAAGEAHMQAAA